MSLLVLKKTTVQINDKLGKIAAMASENKLEINMANTKEIVVHRSYTQNLLLPTTLPGIERVLSAKLLGFWLQSYL